MGHRLSAGKQALRSDPSRGRRQGRAVVLAQTRGVLEAAVQDVVEVAHASPFMRDAEPSRHVRLDAHGHRLGHSAEVPGPLVRDEALRGAYAGLRIPEGLGIAVLRHDLAEFCHKGLEPPVGVEWVGSPAPGVEVRGHHVLIVVVSGSERVLVPFGGPRRPARAHDDGVWCGFFHRLESAAQQGRVFPRRQIEREVGLVEHLPRGHLAPVVLDRAAHILVPEH